MHDSTQRSGLHAAVFEALPLPALVHGRDTISAANASALRLLDAGLKESLIGKPVADIVHPDARAAGEQRRSLLLEQGKAFVGLPLKLRTTTGEERHVVVGAVRFEFDGTHHALVVVTPLESPFRVRPPSVRPSRAPEATNLFEAALTALPLPLLVVHDRRIAFINTAACGLLGHECTDDLMGIEALDVLHPQARTAMEERVGTLMSVGANGMAIPLKTIGRDGSSDKVDAVAFALQHDGRNHFAFAVTRAPGTA